MALDAVVAATGSTKSTTGQLDLRVYIPLFSFVGALCGSIVAAFAQVQIARFNADRSDRSRLAARREEIVSEGILGLIRLDPCSKKDGEANQLALRSANSIKLFLDDNRMADKRLEESVDTLIHLYSCIANPSQDEELVDRIMSLEDPDSDASSIEIERLEDLLELLEDARTEALMAARELIADDRARLQSQSAPR
ncbi:hypothetical protein [Vulcanococcus limneticus]|uniref:hypothetical protein n=1 Tax=Vulcanococcus limneticus TaxID=2170428 RepID=UPI0012FFD186|nr:hypothetical protein [Vulcanococcus limneticus]